MNSLSPIKSELTGFIDPQTPVTKECPVCETIFEAPRYMGKKYCSLRCRRKAKNFRETKRYETIRASVTDTKSPYFMSVPNPSIEQLDKCAKLLADETTNDKPIRVVGLVPNGWNVPPTVVFVKQQKLSETDPDEWIMFHPAMIE